KVIANHLFAVMSQHRYKKQIKPGDVMVALFENGDAASSGSYLAILKIDPSDAILREVETVDGKQQVVFKTRDDRVPDVEEKGIQKIAVLEADLQELMILDNNIQETAVAHFFYDNFLGATLLRSPKEVTQSLLGGVKFFVSRKADAVKPALQPAER